MTDGMMDRWIDKGNIYTIIPYKFRIVSEKNINDVLVFT